MNKSEPVVQNFIKMMDDTWMDEEMVEEILKYFSDIPTLAHTITKLRTLIQGEEEAIVTYNQKYRTLVKRVEWKPVEKNRLLCRDGTVPGQHNISHQEIHKKQHLLQEQARSKDIRRSNKKS